jgi:hypothetical protein
MEAGAVVTVAFSPRQVGTPVTVILIGKYRLPVELPTELHREV